MRLMLHEIQIQEFSNYNRSKDLLFRRTVQCKREQHFNFFIEVCKKSNQVEFT